MPATSKSATALRTLLIASRPLSWINTAYPFTAAYVLGVGRVDAPLVIGTLFFLVPYNLLMYGVNDVFDYESDLANPRKGGAEGAKLPPELHRTTLVASALVAAPFVVVLAVFGLQHPLSLVVLAVSLFAVLAYSVRGLSFKEIPILDSVTSSTHFVTPALFGIALAGTTMTVPLALAMLAFFLWGMASHAFGAVQDIEPDRAAGIGSVATAFGAAATVRLALALWAVAGLLMLAAPWPASLAALGAIPYLIAVAPYLRVTDSNAHRSNRAWRHFLAINYAVGFGITLVLIGCAMTGVFA